MVEVEMIGWQLLAFPSPQPPPAVALQHSVLNQGFLYTNFDFFYKTLQTFSLVLTSLDMMFEQ